MSPENSAAKLMTSRHQQGVFAILVLLASIIATYACLAICDTTSAEEASRESVQSLLEKSSSISTYSDLVEIVKVVESFDKAQVDLYLRSAFQSTNELTRAAGACVLNNIQDRIDYPKQWLVAMNDSSELVREVAAITADAASVDAETFRRVCGRNADPFIRAAYVLKSDSLDDLNEACQDADPLVRMLVARRVGWISVKLPDVDRKRAKKIIDGLVVDHVAVVRSNALLVAHVCGFPAREILRGLLTDSREVISCEDILTTDEKDLGEPGIKAAWVEIKLSRPRFPADVLLRQLQIVKLVLPSEGMLHFTLSIIGEPDTIGKMAADMLLHKGVDEDVNLVRAAANANGVSTLLKQQLQRAIEQVSRKK